MSTVQFQTPACAGCGQRSVVTLDKAAFEAWQAGTLIQEAFPTMSREARETLKTGFHPACWTKMFGVPS